MKLLAFLILMAASLPTVAAEITGEYVQAIIHTIRVPAGGTLEEGIALSNEWRRKVLDQNPHMKSITYLGRAVSDSEYKLLVLYEYENAEEAQKAGRMIGEIMQTAWQDAGGSEAFLAKLNRYINPAENIRHRYQTVARD